MQGPHNIIEDIARDYLKSALLGRSGICTCDQCQNDMLACILSKVPARYATTERGALHTVIEQARVENEAPLARAVLEAIETVSKNPRHDQKKEDDDETFQVLLDKIFEDRRLDFRHYRKELVKRRIALRLRSNNITTYAEYIRLLMIKPEEYDRLFETMCINVSEFFRDPDVWASIRSIFESIIAEKHKKKETTFRIWSAGCANGEEPYSIAILAKELMASGKALNITFEIIATDVDKKCLRIAEKAEYIKTSVKNVLNTDQFFSSAGSLYRLKDDVKNMVQFRNVDLIGQPGIECADVVFCRNVFIYFNRSLQEQLLMKFYKALRPGGYLIKGQTESLISEALQIFEEVDSVSRIYRSKQ